MRMGARGLELVTRWGARHARKLHGCNQELLPVDVSVMVCVLMCNCHVAHNTHPQTPTHLLLLLRIGWRGTPVVVGPCPQRILAAERQRVHKVAVTLQLPHQLPLCCVPYINGGVAAAAVQQAFPAPAHTADDGCVAAHGE